jgi:hypothetical protein
LPVTFGIVIFFARFRLGRCRGRARMRFLFVAIVLGLGFMGPLRWPKLWRSGRFCSRLRLSWLAAATAVLIPIGIIHGILRHRLFDLDAVVRASVAYGAALLLIAAAYAVVAATPGLMLGDQVPVTLAVSSQSLLRSPSSPCDGDLNPPSAEAVRRPRRAVSTTQESRHDDGADGRTR